MRYNEVRDFTADLLSEICSDVAVQPHLHLLSGESLQWRTANIDDEARLDVSARGVWRRGECPFFDIRVFYPNASSYRHTNLQQVYRNHEQEKQCAYGERVKEIKGGSFTPLVFSSTGEMGKEASTFFKHIANIISSNQIPLMHKQCL